MNQGLLRGARKPGLLGLAISLALVLFNLHEATTEGFVYLKSLVIGIALFPIGLAMLACPGSWDLQLFTPPPPGHFMNALTPFERFVWIAAAVAGLGGGLFVLFAL